MDKHITKCGCCGTDVCTTINDNDPICSVCFTWAQRLETEHNQRLIDFKEVEHVIGELLTRIDSLEIDLTALDMLVPIQARHDKLKSIMGLKLVVNKAKPYIEEFLMNLDDYVSRAA